MTALVSRPEWATSTRRAGEQVIHERQLVIIDEPFDDWSPAGHSRAMVQIERWDHLDLDTQTYKVGPVEVYVEIPNRPFDVAELRQLGEALSQAADLAGE